jgi:TatD DNase family protein
MLIDTHAHLWWDSYENDLPEVIERARIAGVEKMVVPGTNLESSRKAIELAKKYPGIIYGAVGIHPEELLGPNSSEETLNRNIEETPPTFGVPTRPLAGSPVEESPLGLRDLLSGGDLGAIVAIGEIGTDMSTAELKNCIDEQKVLFREQCELAIELDLPVIIHTRDSFEETWEVLSSLPTMPRGQFHCFSVDEEAISKVVDAGFYVSFCGNIMYSKRVGKLVPLVPNERLLLETDSPFMKPGERNEPEFVRTLAEKVAELRGQTVEKIEEMTTVNANRLFHL